MLNEVTKKAIVTEKAPPEMATHLKLNADRYNTYVHMKWQVRQAHKKKKKKKRTGTSTTSGRKQKGEGIEQIGRKKGRKATEETQTQAREESKGNDTCAKSWVFLIFSDFQNFVHLFGYYYFVYFL